MRIGFFGRRNAGKSSLLNALAGQSVSIVSDVPGTTTDPVAKAMEILPLGPVLLIDTAGLDDTGDLGRQRVERSLAELARTDLAVLVAAEWDEREDALLARLKERRLPVIVGATQCDRRPGREVEESARRGGAETVVRCSARTGEGIAALREAVLRLAPEDFINAPSIVGDLVPAGGLVVLVVPIDIEAPRGRLILPQVQTLRDVLDHDGHALVVKERELEEALAGLRRPPALVVTDSQEFLKVASVVPDPVPLTSFSILMARFKGDLAALVRGVTAIDRLRPGDRVLIAEACAHHPLGEDIGRVKIPRWIEQYVGGRLEFATTAGPEFPADLSSYRLVVHCGSCVSNRRQMLSRIGQAMASDVPITNYGLAIAFSLGILDRALRPFGAAAELYAQERARARGGGAGQPRVGT